MNHKWTFSEKHKPQTKHAMKKSALENAVSPEIQIEGEWTGGDGRRYMSYRIWLNEGWSQSFMKVWGNSRWQTTLVFSFTNAASQQNGTVCNTGQDAGCTRAEDI